MGKRKRITFGKSKKIKKNIAKNEKSAVVLENNPQTCCTFVAGKEYTGAQVNAANLGPLVKLTTESENHNGFVFVTGENRDTIPFCPYASCSAGGIYFCKIADAQKWLQYNFSKMHYMRSVTLPDDARVYIEDGKMKADKFILGEREEIFTSKTLFNELLKGQICIWNKPTHFDFDTSFYDEHAWNIIIRNPYFEAYYVTERLRSPVLNKLVFQQLEKKAMKANAAFHLLGAQLVFENEDICEMLVSMGLSYWCIRDSYKTRQVLRCFIRQRRFEDVGLFPSSLFLDETLLDGISLSRQELKTLLRK
jgi:hypothetical protein